ncbi:MAG: DUF4365 domain-containing protein [Symploca sp. SIO1C2]|nr:DUF4365 domain-containing protein [Symploca sp. SIO1C2]NER45273.1 DUF4365 domain-containing protein [Symploca sp. SIO1A3]
MDENTKKEEFSYGYIKLICSISGYSVEISGRPRDNSGIDLTIIAPGEIGDIDSPIIEAQVKCTTLAKENNGLVKYPLKVENYNKLINIKSFVPRILIVVLVPHNISNWLEISEKETIMKKCAYWASLKGKKPTNNKKTVTVEIPKENLFTPEAISKLMQQAAKDRAKLFNDNFSLEEQIKNDST